MIEIRFDAPGPCSPPYRAVVDPAGAGRFDLTIARNFSGEWGGPEQTTIRMPESLAREIRQALAEALGKDSQERAA